MKLDDEAVEAVLKARYDAWLEDVKTYAPADESTFQSFDDFAAGRRDEIADDILAYFSSLKARGLAEGRGAKCSGEVMAMGDNYIELFSNTPLPQLAPVQIERLALLSEELGEAVQAVGKILRHGFYSRNPDGDETQNYAALERELGDVMAAIHLLEECGPIAAANIRRSKAQKLSKVAQYLHHSAIAMKETQECQHNQWKWGLHGRCCPCGALMMDAGD